MRHRRRNPDYLNIALLGAIGVGLYVLYRAVTGVPKAAVTAISTAQQAAASKVADWWETLFPFTSTTFAPGSTIVLGDGSEIPSTAAQGVGQFTGTDNQQHYQFVYQAKVYQTTGITPDETNTYYATTNG